MYLRASRGSADNFFETARKLSGFQSDDSSLDQSPVFYDPNALPSRRWDNKEATPLPPVDIARQYFAAQHMYIGTIFSLCDPQTFERHLKEVYEDPPNLADTTSCLMHAKVLAILALGRLYSVNRKSDAENKQFKDDPPGFGYFTRALALLPDIHEKGSLLGVETFAYVGYFMQNMNCRDAAFLYIGVALRMAISLGLHQEAPASANLSESERERRRRVWWSIYSLDRILTLKSGNPISIFDEDIGVNKASLLPGEADDSPVAVLRCYTELSRILGDITTLIYRRTSHTGQTLIATVHSILLSLSQWEEALPKALRLDPEKGKLSRESISMYLHYYQCINMTVRPLLFHVIQKRLAAIRAGDPASQTEKERDWQSGLSKKTIAVISGCILAARSTVLVMTKAAEHNMVATYGYMDGEHAFSAAIVLALVCGSFPRDPNNLDSMVKGLDLLKSIGERGNSYVLARYRLLARLQSIFAVPDASHEVMLPVDEPHDPDHPPPRFPPGEGNCVSVPNYVPVDTQPHEGLQRHVGPADAMGFTDRSYFNFDLDGFDTSSALFDASTNMLVEDADNNMWTTAFTNSVNFDISQLVPETQIDMADYFGL
ncbi:fungal specific transcription factor [Niveomyces insectorum RCEF 264]|uniref:Fungal specific transcription factor n=1 Tax=Niveomyces insectorum RCEF 264 TaxID=1081102 RepID=A0A162J8M6_9HYPO|nr:fungal specific transcription factor [Niveomyces insectorum RCEF 264]